jgi:hypothetical protein
MKAKRRGISHSASLRSVRNDGCSASTVFRAEQGVRHPAKSKRDSSLREPTASSRKTIRDAKTAQERSGKKKSARSVRNDRRWAGLCRS